MQEGEEEAGRERRWWVERLTWFPSNEKSLTLMPMMLNTARTWVFDSLQSLPVSFSGQEQEHALRKLLTPPPSHVTLQQTAGKFLLLHCPAAQSRET